MATRYAYNGQELTLAQLKEQAKGKSIDFMSGSKEKLTFHIVMDDEGTVFPITRAQFNAAKLEDLTTEHTLLLFHGFEVKRLLGQMTMSQKCTYNVWCKQKERTTAEKLQYLQSL